MLNSNRGAYQPLIPDLREAGYAILNIDMRGHGASGGDRVWDSTIADMQGWVDWLAAEGRLSEPGLAIIGGSIGANVALISCADTETCRGAIALSPGLDYRGVKPESALVDGLADRSALLVAAQNDASSSTAIRQMFLNAKGDVTARLYPGRAHGTRLFDSEYRQRKRLDPRLARGDLRAGPTNSSRRCAHNHQNPHRNDESPFSNALGKGRGWGRLTVANHRRKGSHMNFDLASVDYVLETTRSVRQRLDLTRPVERGAIERCLEIAIQAPTGSNQQGWKWLVLTDAEKKAQIGEYYKQSWYEYAAVASRSDVQSLEPSAQMKRVINSARYLADHMGEAPMMIFPCIHGRARDASPAVNAGLYGSIIPRRLVADAGAAGPWHWRRLDDAASQLRERMQRDPRHSRRCDDRRPAAHRLFQRRDLPKSRPRPGQQTHLLGILGRLS